MGTSAFIVWALILDDTQEFQRITVKNMEGYPDVVRREVIDFYKHIRKNHLREINSIHFLVTEFCKMYPDYWIYNNWFLYDYFYYLKIRLPNPKIEWWLQSFELEKNSGESWFFNKDCDISKI